MICIFDCESVPDVNLLKEIYGYDGNEEEVCKIAFKEQEKITNSTFLPLVFHKIVSISGLICDEFGNFIKIGNYGQKYQDRNELIIIKEFLNYINKNNPKLISFNGRTFDLPLIMLRAMQYNLNASAYFEIDNHIVNKSKWDNYRQRYSENFHIDLLDSISSFGLAKNIRLNLICKMLGIPGKFDVNGNDVWELFYINKDLNKIDDYCQSDVLNTYWLFLKYNILQGKIDIKNYKSLLNTFFDKIPNNKNYSEVFKKAIIKEINKLEE